MSGVVNTVECQKACQANTGCYFFAMNTATSMCYLIAWNGVEGKETKSTDWVSGPKYCVWFHKGTQKNN